VTTLLDAFAVLALLKGERAAPHVTSLIDSGGSALTTLGVAEVVDHLVRIVGITEDDAALDIAQLGLADPQPLTAALALRAGLLRARHYHRSSRAVSLADCVVAETARSRQSSVATSDPHLLDLCRDEGIGVTPLPDSHGVIWSP
jgi:PIN domain nuclease of toxin-antitoxin system